MNRHAAPDRTEASEYYFRYIDRVPAGDVCDTLAAQLEETLALLRGVSEEGSRFRYEPDKWSLRQVMSHVTDTERVFALRAWWFARGIAAPLPGFDQDVAIAAAAADERPWRDHLDEFAAVRASSVTLFRGLPAEAWSRRGIASDNPFTVHAVAFVIAGHAAHHLAIVREKYL